MKQQNYQVLNLTETKLSKLGLLKHPQIKQIQAYYCFLIKCFSS